MLQGYAKVFAKSAMNRGEKTVRSSSSIESPNLSTRKRTPPVDHPGGFFVQKNHPVLWVVFPFLIKQPIVCTLRLRKIDFIGTRDICANIAWEWPKVRLVWIRGVIATHKLILLLRFHNCLL